MTTHTHDTATLVTEYLNVANAAIDAHRDETPYKQILSLTDKLADDHRFGIEVYRRGADGPHDYYTAEWNNGGLRYVSHGKEAPDVDFRVSEEHMQRVVDDAEEYIAHPAKIDLDWLKSRVGLS